jgi:CheY-like chemotaxis protein
MDEHLRDAQKLEQIGRLAGGVAHDFNNLLTIIISESELALSSPPADDDTRQHFDDILAAARAGSDLTRQLLAFARRSPMELAPVDVNALIERTRRLFARLAGDRVTYHTDLAPDAGDVVADVSQLEQVLSNLIVNARDAMPNGGSVTVITRRHREPRGGNPALEGRRWTVIEVRDDGVGIPDDVRAHIFEPFFTTKARGKGTGLGLATCFGIVQRFGGVITVDSEQGLGTTFRVYLPTTAASLAVEDHPEEPSAPTAAPAGVVLVVDDQPAVRAVAARVLKREGYLVLAAETGAEALAIASDRGNPRPDVILLDVNLPDGDGRDMMPALRAAVPGVAILLASGAAGTLARAGDTPILEKPYSVATLTAAVRSAMRPA